MASIVDRPKESQEQDLLGIDKYTNGLIKFIDESATPLTIGIQGEWGSGKTSLLNTIKEDLCDAEKAKHFSIWINTWEYSLLSTPDETLVKIISGLVTQIGELITNRTTEKGKKAAGTVGFLMKNLGSSLGGIAGKTVQIAGEAIESAVNKPQDNSIKALRVALQEVIDEALKASNGEKKSFIFFVDDLDRLDPAVAVSILELIKNLFDLKNCIFVLAIDYGVVVKGLQSKFGKMTEENEWEFRAFFDKIIQLPFSMPISSYNISSYLQAHLLSVNYFSQSDFESTNISEKLTNIVRLSVGTNPRSLKRLVNSVGLIEIIRGNEDITIDEKVIEFSLICIQISYPLIYRLIQQKPDFTEWDNQYVLQTIRNKSIDESDLELLKDTEEFDDEWEQNLWRVCQINSYLKQKVHNISKLFNFIVNNCPTEDSEDIGGVLGRLLKMSSVTSVSAETVHDESPRTRRRVDFSDWDDYTLWLKEEKELADDVILDLKKFIDTVRVKFSKDVNIKFGIGGISVFKNTQDDKTKLMAKIWLRKKGFVLELADISHEVSKEFPQYRHNAKYNILIIKVNNYNDGDVNEILTTMEKIYFT